MRVEVWGEKGFGTQGRFHAAPKNKGIEKAGRELTAARAAPSWERCERAKIHLSWDCSCGHISVTVLSLLYHPRTFRWLVSSTV